MTDPVNAHVEALARVLRGPTRMRRDMLAETRDGLRDAADRHGDPVTAVAEFGSVAEVAPHYQAELTAAQGRRTALIVAVLFPTLLLGWDLLWTHGVAWTSTAPPPELVLAMARAQDVVSAVVTGCAVLVLAATLHRGVSPRLLAAAAASVALIGAVVCGGAAVVMNVANGPATAQMLATNPAALPSFLLSGAALLAILFTACRALRVAVC